MSPTVVKKKRRKKTLSSSPCAVVLAGWIKPNNALGRESVILLFGLWEMSCPSLLSNLWRNSVEKKKSENILISIQKH